MGIVFGMLLRMWHLLIPHLLEYKFYFHPGSGDPASKHDRPLFETGIYEISVSTSNQK